MTHEKTSLGVAAAVALTILAALGAKAAPTLHILHSFTGGAAGGYPASGLAWASGVFYGTTVLGGAYNQGVVYSLTPPGGGAGWTYSVLYSFGAYPSDGSSPDGNVTVGPNGVLYGMTVVGGTSNAGTVYALAPPASPGGVWTETTLYDFTRQSSIIDTHAGVVIGSGGVLYGATQAGGTANLGMVFSLTPPSVPGGAWTETTLYSFKGTPDGSAPLDSLVIGPNGSLYGTTSTGGTSNNGTVFELTPMGGGVWRESVLYSFGGTPDGWDPVGGLVVGAHGVLYGTTARGGTCGGAYGNDGTAFKLTPMGGGVWTETVIHNFGAPGDGIDPLAGVAIDWKNGALYGTTFYGGTATLPVGTVYEITSSGETVLYSFPGIGNQGPICSLIIGSGGARYGTTYELGAANAGTIFALAP